MSVGRCPCLQVCLRLRLRLDQRVTWRPRHIRSTVKQIRELYQLVPPGSRYPTLDDVTESTATLLGLGRLVSPDVDPLQVADLVSSPEESKAAGFDPIEADGGAEPGRQTWAVPPAGTPAAAVEGASVDSAEASSTATAAARSAMSADGAGPVEPGLVEPGTLGQTVHGQHVQRSENVPPGLANGRRSPATVAESGGGTVVVPPAAPDIRLSSSDTGPGPSPVPVHVSAGGSAQPGPVPAPDTGAGRRFRGWVRTARSGPRA